MIWDKILEILRMPAYVKVETIEISNGEILELIKEGKVRINQNGLVEFTDHSLHKNITIKAKALEEN